MDEAEASEALQAAVGGVSDACEQLLVCLRKQDQVRVPRGARGAAPWPRPALYPAVLKDSNKNDQLQRGNMGCRFWTSAFHQVAQAAALGFEACDGRLRDAVKDALRVAVAVEFEAATKRLEVSRRRQKEGLGNNNNHFQKKKSSTHRCCVYT